MDVVPHYCTGQGCEALHGGSRESDDVRIAKINADRDIRVAELARNEARQEIEAEVEQTEIVAEASVEASVIEAAVLSDVITPDPAPAPEPVELPVDMPEPEPEVEAVPGPPEQEPPTAPKGDGGWWGGYR
jgi:outer membrane biosynthesis protein TonB